MAFPRPTPPGPELVVTSSPQGSRGEQATAAGGHAAVPVIGLDSLGPLPQLPVSAVGGPGHGRAEPATAAAGPLRRGTHGIWLDGDVLMCACPDCGAPISVRVWLMMAQCWNCQTCIELSEAQERVARELLADRAAQRQQPAAETSPPSARPAAAQPLPHRPHRHAASGSAAGASAAVSRRPPTPTPTPTPTPPSRVRADRPAAARQRRAARPRRRSRVRRTMEATPAWLISLVLHVVALTLMALWTFGGDEDERAITLSTVVDRRIHREGGDLQLAPDTGSYDLPVPPDYNPENARDREALVRADQDARLLRVDPDLPLPGRPSVDEVKRQLSRSGRSSAALLARDPRIRVDVVKREGGTTLTEAAVARGLKWLAAQQGADGNWELDGSTRSRCAATSLALLPFLGAGQTHLAGPFRPVVSRGLRWLLDHQADNGDLRDHRGDTMYAHGQGAIVLCEAFLLTGDEQLREPAQRAINFIVDAQHKAGGWRYKPGEAGDTSVVGWQVMALQSARSAKLEVPDYCLQLADQYLDQALVRSPGFRAWARRWRAEAARHQLLDLAELMEQGDWSPQGIRNVQLALAAAPAKIAQSPRLTEMSEQFALLRSHLGQYAYQPGGGPKHTMTAEALLCRMYLGWNKQDVGLVEGVKYLIANHLPDQRQPNTYYWYYATQVMHHYGGPEWETWNQRMRNLLVERQVTRGPDAGCWRPSRDDPFSLQGGKIYCTALSVCTLEVYYRHLPIFRQLDLE